MEIISNSFIISVTDAEDLVNELLTVSNDLQVMVDSNASENFKREFTALWERKNELILRIVREMTGKQMPYGDVLQATIGKRNREQASVIANRLKRLQPTEPK